MSTSREDAAAIRARIIREYYEGQSYGALADRYGYNLSTVAKFIARDKRDNGVRQRSCRPKDPRPYAVKRSLSQAHFQIGLAISLYRAEHNLNPTQFGMLLARENGSGNKSRCKVRDMEIGAYDLTLTDIQRLSEILGIPFETLVIAKAAKVG